MEHLTNGMDLLIPAITPCHLRFNDFLEISKGHWPESRLINANVEVHPFRLPPKER
jgi:hypothetical protein